nr:HD domain-containing phosphohydrolase [Salipaludibacillus sp. CUR1]
MSHYFPEERIQRWEVELLAVIHFVSRVQWPDYLFEKEERLTDIEFEVVKQHCVMGRDIIGEDAAFSRIRTAAEQHHERIDGKGYPYGLGGEEIAVLSQILGITEAYLAMTTSRAYREALSCEEALGQIRKEKGGTFDPNVVNAFLKVMSGKSSQTDVKAS